VLIRPRAFIAEETGFYINVNHCYSSLSGWQETAITQRVVAGQAAYLAMAPHKACVSVEPVSESEGRKLLSRTVFMKVLH